ncbi:cardioactive peptide isoform X2 [Neocloeon triangulifer]|uniref:cardioactive peptide isoform X2 n=1 Tax=Neocloeon triangulifer TaxID=2078957 RepID=UPI00286F8598|nr:cardioactive peptide isoform X2 [Neocloeon triangulifer]
MLSSSQVTCLAICALVLVNLVASRDIRKREVDDSDAGNEPKRKRPFCNAFTGCGRKRSDESMGALVDVGQEPLLADVNRQIISEAKLWEAIQEARNELLRQRHQQMMHAPGGLMERELPLFRKRRDVLNRLPEQHVR